VLALIGCKKGFINFCFLKNLEPQVHGALIDALRSWASQYGQDPNMDELVRIHNKLNADPAGTRVRPLRRDRADTQESSVPREEDIPGDIELARNNCQVLAQTLSFTDPGKEDISKNELIQVFSIKLVSKDYKDTFSQGKLVGILWKMQRSAYDYYATFANSL
jgi:hypothetical protein